MAAMAFELLPIITIVSEVSFITNYNTSLIINHHKACKQHRTIDEIPTTGFPV